MTKYRGRRPLILPEAGGKSGMVQEFPLPVEAACPHADEDWSFFQLRADHVVPAIGATP